MRRAGGLRNEEATGRRNPRPCGGQTIASARVCRAQEVNMHSGGCDVAVVTNPPRLAREAVAMAQDVTVQEAVDSGAQEQ